MASNSLVNLSIAAPDNPLPAAERFVALARGVKVTSVEECEIASADVAEIKSRRNNLDAARKTLLAPLKEGVDRINAFFKPAIDALDDAERTVKGAIGTFTIAQQQRADRERREAEEAGRKEQERLRQEAAERQRLADEEAARQRAEAEVAAKAGDTEKATQLQQQAEQTAEAGAAEAAELTEAASTMPLAAHVPGPAKISGVQMRDNWGAEVTSMEELVQAVATGKVPMAAVCADTTFLNKMAKAMKSGLAYPGVRAVNTPVVASRRVA